MSDLEKQDLRLILAAVAMHAIVRVRDACNPEMMSEDAFQYADALLARSEMEKKEPRPERPLPPPEPGDEIPF